MYDIIATLGPATSQPDLWSALEDAGATAFRLNTSHLSIDETTTWLDALRHPTPVVLDLQGSKWRIGVIADIVVEAGRKLLLVSESATAVGGGELRIPVPHPEFFTALRQARTEVRLNDAKVTLAVDSVGPDSARAVVIRGGPLSAGKGITIPGSAYRNEALGEKDRRIIDATRGRPGVRFAVSYVRDEVEMRRYRDAVGDGAYLIAKIERRSAIEAASEIATNCSELWLCRGDLGAELGPADMAKAVAAFSKGLEAEDVSSVGNGPDGEPSAGVRPAGAPARPAKPPQRKPAWFGGSEAAPSGAYGVPAIMAGQVFEHMTEHPTPTRSEVCYLYDILARGYSGVVLSDETAVGRYPVEACRAASLFGTGRRRPA